MFFKVVGRITAAVFRSIGKLFYTISRSMGKHPIGAVVTIALVVAIGVMLYVTDIFGLANGTFLGGGGDNAVVTPTERKQEPEGKSTEFLNALKGAKAGDMYAALSDDYKKLLKQRGVDSSKVMQDLIEDKLTDITKEKGARLNYKFTYIIGTRYSDGSADDNFTGTLESKTARRAVEFVMKVKNGKITDIQTTDPVTLAALGTNKVESKEAAQLGVFADNRSANAELFMAGLTTFDAAKVWEALSDSYREQLTAKGLTQDSMKKLFDEVKAENDKGGANNAALTYNGYAYVQTINFPNGVSVNVFVSSMSLRDNAIEPGYNIVLDKSNKIIKLGNDRAEDPIFSAILGRSRGG